MAFPGQTDWQTNIGNLGNLGSLNSGGIAAGLNGGLGGSLGPNLGTSTLNLGNQIAGNLVPMGPNSLGTSLGNNLGNLGSSLGNSMGNGLGNNLGSSLAMVPGSLAMVPAHRGEKRGQEEGDNFTSSQQQQQQQQQDKRPRQSFGMGMPMDAFGVDAVERMAAALEPYLRRIVSDEMDKYMSRMPGPVAPRGAALRDVPRIGHLSTGSAEGSAVSRTMRLSFRNKLVLPLFTGGKVEGEGGSIHVVLQDSSTGQLVGEGMEANLRLEIVVLEGDFAMDDDEDWTREEFEQFIVREREGKRPLLTGETGIQLKDGVGVMGDITFTDNSSWIRSRKFRLGVRPAGLPGALAVSGGATGGSGQASGSQQSYVAPEEAARVREGKTEAFTVKDHRGELYKKHYPPALNDEVWRLDRIGKDGAFHKRLNQAGIFTVEDFLRLVVMDPQKLRNILGSGMSNKMWEGTVEHAKTCVLNGKLHVYYADEKQNIGVIFNNIFQLMGLIADGQYMSVDLLSDSEKIYVDKLVKVAYENWENVVEYDGEALIGVGGGRANGAGADL